MRGLALSPSFPWKGALEVKRLYVEANRPMFVMCATSLCSSERNSIATPNTAVEAAAVFYLFLFCLLFLTMRN
ncbi:hypothetical protein PROFUN_08109 [Planoprotostelium fungivorum]|uniref:Uncharacterized protein n=1 Tax=Planoprotostelium fungivorum TaxID=1890364 RepID=A0A2P6NKI1_9EUKA|nr:hypothetical protein PROFUN_08109 [Planoprotostelium fungivorum]